MNLGNPIEFSIKELADKVVDLTNSKSIIVKRPLPEDDPKQRRPNIAMATAALDWEPRVGLEEGLRKTIAYFEELASEGLLGSARSGSSSRAARTPVYSI
jgi:UDP-glucuronate decarboxylase